MTQHRIMLTKRLNTLLDILEAYTHRICHFLLSLQVMGNKLMQRRIKQTHRHRTAFHCLENSLEVSLLVGKNLSQSLLAFKEHVFRTAKTDTHSAKITCYCGIMRSIRIGTNLQLRIFVCQIHQFRKVTGQLSRFCLHLSLYTSPVLPFKEI